MTKNKVWMLVGKDDDGTYILSVECAPTKPDVPKLVLTDMTDHSHLKRKWQEAIGLSPTDVGEVSVLLDGQDEVTKGKLARFLEVLHPSVAEILDEE